MKSQSPGRRPGDHQPLTLRGTEGRTEGGLDPGGIKEQGSSGGKPSQRSYGPVPIGPRRAGDAPTEGVYGQVMAADLRARPQDRTKITLQVKLEGKTVTALVDSGCSQTMVRTELVPEWEAAGGNISMQCIHGDVRTYPTGWVRLSDGVDEAICRVALAPKLVYPVLLGRDWPGFRRILHEWDAQEQPPPAGVANSTRGMPQGPREEPEPEKTLASEEVGGEEDFQRDQREDPSLTHAWEQATGENGDPDGTAPRPTPRFEVRADRLYRVARTAEGQTEVTQLLVPARFRRRVLDLAHANPWAGHLGREKTLQRITQRFFWPGIYKEVRDFCESCPDCQKTGQGGVPKAPLVPLPVVEVPFDRVALDLVGPLERSRRGHQYIMVIIDYATRYPEAVPLKNTTASTLAQELVQVFSRVGIPREILTDQGTNVTSKLMAELCRLLNIKALRTSVYHPQTDGLVERFNRTLKGMLRRFVELDPKDWDRLLPALLFAVREVPQASTGFSPFELLYGRQPRGILDLVREAWEEQDSRVKGTVPYILDLQKRLRTVGELAKENLLQAQNRQAQYYNRGAKSRTFQPGDRVLLLLPTPDSKLLAKWQGPFEVIRQVGPVDYEIRLSGKRKDKQIYHVNLLKKWNAREGMLVTLQQPEPELGPWGGDLEAEGATHIGAELTEAQRREMNALLREYKQVLTTQPGKTPLTSHHIATTPGKKIRDHIRPLPKKMWEPVREELQRMLQMGVVRESRSEWRSPIVLVPKSDGTMRFCIDFRKVNAISRFDAYPMPRVNELLERLGKAHYISTLDLTKGYWQIPLTPASEDKTAFATPFGLFQFITMPFGLNGAAATFQRLMDKVLYKHQEYAAAYIDDIVIYSETWLEHLQHLKAVLGALADAKLTANPGKCHFGQREVSYLGYVVRRGRIKPQVDKVEALRSYKAPTTKRQVRQFLGLASYYRRFIPEFATIAAPLTDLTQNARPQRVQWTAQCEKAFQTLKRRLMQTPVLHQPDFTKPFIVQTDASDRGLGAVLSQEQEGEEHPILYLSRKLLPRELQYATIEKEALAAKWAIEALRYYLLGGTFTLITDHAPLRWIQTMKETNLRIMRWYLALQPYKFEVCHRPGRTHNNADFFSRSLSNGEAAEGDGALGGGAREGAVVSH
uniref:Gypsy retrotransposon integrase-like protein 1 n=1 Tax=Pelodiscus sinensis TaxID=13735 RepID=K7EX43_PELSI